jgi:hypoxanthine phosphoribosyltransferase
MHREILFSETVIAERVKALAKQIAASPFKPQVAAPVLVGAYVFAADLLRALTYEGYSLPTEFIWLRSYVGHESSKQMKVLVAPTDNFRGKNVLLIDGVLDGGHTIKKARDLAFDFGASQVQSVVMVDKLREDAVAKADFAAFTGVGEFIVGYGMDDSGQDRALPYIGKAV